MASGFFNKKQNPLKEKYVRKYRIAIQNDSTFEERASIKVSRFNVILMVLVYSFLIVGITGSLIFFTPIREWIPGYTQTDLGKNLYQMDKLADSTMNALRQNELYLTNLKNIIEGKEPIDFIDEQEVNSVPSGDYDTIIDRRSKEDSLLRVEYEEQSKYNLFERSGEHTNADKQVEYGTFMPPLKGMVSADFDPSKGHFGVDVVAKSNAAVNCVRDGTVVFSDWTSDNGHVIAIQHSGNYISIYKHNSVLLKKTGDYVHSGEAIAIIGESGHLANGPHLHFELWYKGMPVNPNKYMVF